MKDWTAEPLTEEDLTDLWDYATSCPPEPADAYAIGRTVREVRRLRSDDWLEKAAEEIEKGSSSLAITHDAYEVADLLAILRKHRDGGCACGHPIHKGPCTYTSGSALPCHCLSSASGPEPPTPRKSPCSSPQK